MSSFDGFWLPRGAREPVLGAASGYTAMSFARGRPARPGDEGAVTARWPLLPAADWGPLLARLRDNRRQAPSGQAWWRRFQAAMAAAAGRLARPSDPLHRLAMASLPAYTGYSPAMIEMTLGAMALWNLERFPAALHTVPTRQATAGWQSLGELPGRLRFYPARRGAALRARLPGSSRAPLFGPLSPPELVVGYGAGNVPGTALLITLLAQATALAGGPPPVTVVKNSRREPIFAPLVLSALEEVDPELVSTIALLVWDYDDQAVQGQLLGGADLVVAAASDETIAHVGSAVTRLAPAGARFHAHGHKVSFSAIGREVLGRGQRLEDGTPLVDVVALLAALDSIYWDQHGCLSSRVHFVEAGGADGYSAQDYAARLAEQLRLLATFLPRGAWPRQRLQDRFDRYTLLAQTGQVQVLSGYDDEFVVICDARSMAAAGGFQLQVNDCEGRVIVVRPVDTLMDVPDRFLRLLPPANLQSLSVAGGRPGQGLTDEFLRFAAACGARGVTAIRTVGRGAFPQLAYSWDGLLPVDLLRQRPAGRFTTIEFDAPYDDMLATYLLFALRASPEAQVAPGLP